MTRKHFKALADVLKEAKPLPSGYDEDRSAEVWESCLRGVAATCQSFNPQFDRAKFYAACGWEG